MDEVWTYEWTKCYMNLTSSYKFLCQMSFQCMISMCVTYKLWMNKFFMIFITKSWNVKFVMYEDHPILVEGVKAHYNGQKM